MKDFFEEIIKPLLNMPSLFSMAVGVGLAGYGISGEWLFKPGLLPTSARVLSYLGASAFFVMPVLAQIRSHVQKSNDEEIKPRISGVWYDLFRIMNATHFAIINLRYEGKNTYSIKGAEFDYEGRLIYPWNEVAIRICSPKSDELNYYFRALPSACTTSANIMGITEVNFELLTDADEALRYSGIFTNLSMMQGGKYEGTPVNLKGRKLDKRYLRICEQEGIECLAQALIKDNLIR
jgi:hypothetical protein